MSEITDIVDAVAVSMSESLTDSEWDLLCSVAKRTFIGPFLKYGSLEYAKAVDEDAGRFDVEVVGMAPARSAKFPLDLIRVTGKKGDDTAIFYYERGLEKSADIVANNLENMGLDAQEPEYRRPLNLRARLWNLAVVGQLNSEQAWQFKVCPTMQEEYLVRVGYMQNSVALLEAGSTLLFGFGFYTASYYCDFSVVANLVALAGVGSGLASNLSRAAAEVLHKKGRYYSGGHPLVAYTVDRLSESQKQTIEVAGISLTGVPKGDTIASEKLVTNVYNQLTAKRVDQRGLR